MVNENAKKFMEPFLRLKQPMLSTENVRKVNINKLTKTENLDGFGQLTFTLSRSSEFIRLAESYLEITFTYNTQTIAGDAGTVGVASDTADVTFENDFVSKLFDRAELKIGGYTVEVIEQCNVVNEIVGLVAYSNDEDRVSGYSMGWIPDYGAGSSELTLHGFMTALNAALPGINITAANPGQLNVPNAGAAAINNATIKSNAINAALANVNQCGYVKRKLFYNKTQAQLRGAPAGTHRTCTLCVPIGHFLQSIISYYKLLSNLQITLLLSRVAGTNAPGDLATTNGINAGSIVYSPVGNVLNPAVTIGYKTTSISWVYPQYVLTPEAQTEMLKEINSKDIHEMLCLTRLCPTKHTTSASSFQINLGARANIPRYILVGIKTNAIGGVVQTDKIAVNGSLFIHGFEFQ